jgi:hypothetical protein
MLIGPPDKDGIASYKNKVRFSKKIYIYAILKLTEN